MSKKVVKKYPCEGCLIMAICKNLKSDGCINECSITTLADVGYMDNTKSLDGICVLCGGQLITNRNNNKYYQYVRCSQCSWEVKAYPYDISM